MGGIPNSHMGHFWVSSQHHSPSIQMFPVDYSWWGLVLCCLSQFADTLLKHCHGSSSILSPLGLFRFHAYFILGKLPAPAWWQFSPFDVLMKILEGFLWRLWSSPPLLGLPDSISLNLTSQPFGPFIPFHLTGYSPRAYFYTSNKKLHLLKSIRCRLEGRIGAILIQINKKNLLLNNSYRIKMIKVLLKDRFSFITR